MAKRNSLFKLNYTLKYLWVTRISIMRIIGNLHTVSRKVVLIFIRTAQMKSYLLDLDYPIWELQVAPIFWIWIKDNTVRVYVMLIKG